MEFARWTLLKVQIRQRGQKAAVQLLGCSCTIAQILAGSGGLFKLEHLHVKPGVS